MVFVSRLAGPAQFGHVVLTHSSILASGDSPVPVGSYCSTSGSNTGNSSSGTGTTPHFSQCTIGIGSPQYLWRENTQSRNLYVVFFCPYFSVTFSFASSEFKPVKSPES